MSCTAGYDNELAKIGGSVTEEAYYVNVRMGEKNGEPDPENVEQVDISGGSRSANAGTRFDFGEGNLRLISGVGEGWGGGGSFREPGKTIADYIDPSPFDTSKNNVTSIHRLGELTQYLVDRAINLPLDLPLNN